MQNNLRTDSRSELFPSPKAPEGDEVISAIKSQTEKGKTITFINQPYIGEALEVVRRNKSNEQYINLEDVIQPQQLLNALISFEHVTQVNLTQCGLSHIPNEICKLSNLTHLLLPSNQLSELPNQINQLQKLEKIFLNQNWFRGFPEILLSFSRCLLLHNFFFPW